jgi:hypothetical protein
MTLTINKTKYRSPNFDLRPDGTVKDTIVVHTTEGYWHSDAEWLCNPVSKVSCHWVVAPDGIVYELVDPSKRAWHAGVSGLNGRDDFNDFSLGIEISHMAGSAWNAAQATAMNELCRWIVSEKSRFPIKREWVVTHRAITQVRPPEKRKSDPSDWNDVDFNRWADSLFAPVDPLKVASIGGPNGERYDCGSGMAVYYQTYAGIWTLGYALGHETITADSLAQDCTIMPFERGVLKYLHGVGVQPALLAEVLTMGW